MAGDPLVVPGAPGVPGAEEAAMIRGTQAERLRLRLADVLNRCVFFPLANLGDAADKVGGRVYEWAERQR